MSTQKIKSNTLYTIIGNTLILVVIGLMLVMLVIGQSLLNDLQDQFSIQVELEDDLSANDIKQVQFMISEIDLVDPSTIVFQDRKSLAQQYKSDLNIDTADELIAEALFDALSFKFKNSNVNSADIIRVESRLLKIPFVSDVNHMEDMSKGLLDNMERIRNIGFVLSLILLVVLIVLIYNNTRLAIYSDRFKIRKMQLVGAIPWFITKPFVELSLRMALISGLIATVVVTISLFAANRHIIDLTTEDILLTITKVGIILLLLSITISVISSYLIVNRYLRMDVDQLYT